MRKLLILVMLTIGIMVNAQETIQSYAVDVSFSKNQSGDWKFKKRKDCHVLFTISGNTIKSNDKAHSIYTTYENLSTTNKEASWNALDERNLNCVITIGYNGPESYIIIKYPNSCYKYFFKN